MIARYLPLLKQRGGVFEKFARVRARRAIPGESLVTVTSAGVETHNTARAGDYVVENPGGEQYIVSPDKFAARYAPIPGDGGDHGDGWSAYQATGRIRAIPYHGPDFTFVASWGEEMVCNDGDMLATTFPAEKDVYRIGKKEFDETYRPSK
jgi:hypothetical protein